MIRAIRASMGRPVSCLRARGGDQRWLFGLGWPDAPCGARFTEPWRKGHRLIQGGASGARGCRRSLPGSQGSGEDELWVVAGEFQQESQKNPLSTLAIAIELLGKKKELGAATGGSSAVLKGWLGSGFCSSPSRTQHNQFPLPLLALRVLFCTSSP